MKWGCVGGSPEEIARFQKLSSALGIANEFVELEWKPEVDFLSQFGEFKHIRFGEAIQPEVAKRLNVQSSWTALLGVTDGMLYRDGRWWPLCAVYESLGSALFTFGKSLDFSASAFVSGSGSMARAGIAALFKCGFRSFRIAAIDNNVEELTRELKVKFFGIEIDQVPVDKIVMLAGVCSLFLNTATEAQYPQLAQELSYLNFLKRPGAIIDTALTPSGSIFLKEASDSGIPSIDGWRIASHSDVLWAKWAFDVSVNEENHQKSLRPT